HYGVVLAPAGEDIDHLADRAVAAQHWVEFAVACLLGEVVGKALQGRFTMGRGLSWLLRLRGQGELAQALGVESGQQRLVMTAGIAQWIAQQREDQRGLVDARLA